MAIFYAGEWYFLPTLQRPKLSKSSSLVQVEARRIRGLTSGVEGGWAGDGWNYPQYGLIDDAGSNTFFNEDTRPLII